ncbi:glyoxalase/bleomycin resistance/dioxygenase family protein [Pseudooceanicola sediminis]|uniref:Glyoxalase/bleomycin resistance/dioxygenase family protein n=1 Tax=Pseudooceanicola sediminis TaxID=2211117 RepID=A0A399IYC6_9RHOB|nr:VOC family protein [Pseudooceanicola sediminis]KAA2316068.1 glyoxalase/bleomycin resistance/dioxygenase family protein [Puniceibacterium sp. HSS470]RII38178.1 glyoxalase/bleomycin resistance/dioxygenase family protein [Pseudooceanicola sediminis]|tara:strand:+ start:25154 stop:25585 length:432 start_codon:yes stop_codon:yes gene_type:complete
MSTANETKNSQVHKLSELVECHGVILFTERYDDCVAFYRDKLGLPLWYEKDGLTCLRFGDGYLMIEKDGIASDTRKTRSENPTAIRFNVASVTDAAHLLQAQGISVSVSEHSWGTTGAFLDPDGNVCSLKNSDDPYFGNTTAR